MSLVAVVGATGRQGLAQIRQLAAAGHKVRALSRSETPNLGGSNVADEVRKFDLEDQSTWVPAFEGTDAVFYTHPLQSRLDRATVVGDVAAAAKEAKSERFIWNTSSWIPERPGDPFTYANNTIAVNKIFRSGMPATVFGSVLFMDNLLTNWARPFIMHEDRYVYPHNPDLEANWISLDDVGKCMIAAMERQDFEGSWLNIGGPQRLKPPEVAETLSKVFGRKIAYDPCTSEQFGDYLVDAFEQQHMPAEKKAEFSAGIRAFYEYNNSAPTKPFEVNFDFIQQRLPEVEFETLEQWAARQDWSDTAHRPPAG